MYAIYVNAQGERDSFWADKEWKCQAWLKENKYQGKVVTDHEFSKIREEYPRNI